MSVMDDVRHQSAEERSAALWERRKQAVAAVLRHYHVGWVNSVFDALDDDARDELLEELLVAADTGI